MKFDIFIPVGFCQCGCGNRTSLVTTSRGRNRPKKGEWNRFLPGHMNRDPIQVVYGHKKCCLCKQYLPVSAFRPLTAKYQRSSHYVAYASRCTTCAVHARKRYYASDHAHRLSTSARLQREYGISIEEYENILVKQNNKCAICLVELQHRVGRNNHLVSCVDHCHATQKIRGVLCGGCNRALGLFKDDAQLLARAELYLKGEL